MKGRFRRYYTSPNDATAIVLANLITNGNYITTTGWTPTACAVAASNNILVVTANGSEAYGMVTKETAVNSAVGKKIFVRCKTRVLAAGTSYIQIIVDGKSAGDNQQDTILAPTANVWNTSAFIITQPANVSGVIVLKYVYVYANAGAASGKVFEAQPVLMLDLTTSFGAGSEPTVDQMNHALERLGSDMWFGGSQNISSAWLTENSTPKIGRKRLYDLVH